MKATMLWIGTFVAACSSGNMDAPGGGGADVCALAMRTCPSDFGVPGTTTPECTPTVACEMQCLLDSGCAIDQRFAACDEHCTSSVVDAGALDTACTGDCVPCHTSADCPAFAPECSAAGRCVGGGGVTDSGTPTPGDDTGSAAGDTSPPSGAWGCTIDNPYSCTCAAGNHDDGKGCSPSTLAAPGGCCASSTRCTCESVLCSSNSGGCTCILGGLPSTSTSCDGPLCCVFPASSSFGFGGCSCYTGGKPGGCAALGGTEVSSCSAGNVPCYYTEDHSVPSCE